MKNNITKPVISVSFSGGRTSAFMAKWLKDNKSDQYDINYVFANTGLEHPKTLDFINECDKRWNLGVVWIEAVVNPEKGKGTGYKIVDYDTASRNAEPFEDVIKVYGIPNPEAPQICTREMKMVPLTKYRNDRYGEYIAAIGIRADEFDRMLHDAEKRKIIYPLISMRHTTKAEVIDWWSRQDFDLEIPEHYGNCVTCWKKSDRKLFTIAKHHPEWFDFMARMEVNHSFSGASFYDNDGNVRPRRWFRKNRTTADIIASSREPFNEFVDYKPEYQLDMFGLDQHSGCEESCEAF